MMFQDRADAGAQLARALAGTVPPDALVLGVPRGGVVVAAVVAKELGLALDVLVVRKIGAPGNPEFAIAAVDEEGAVIGDGERYASAAYLERAAREGRAEIARRLDAYRSGRESAAIAGRTVVLVDDGIATGMTLRAALHSLRRRGAARVVVAVPVAAADAADALADAADELVVLSVPPGFNAVGQFYLRFEQTTDAEVVALLREASQASGRDAEKPR